MTILVLSLAFIIFIVDGLPLLRKKQGKELIVIGLLLGAALFLQTWKDVGFNSPLSILDKLIRPLGKVLLQ